MSSTRVLIYLLRRDLRVADNPILQEISKTSQTSQPPFTHLLPVYVFSAQQIECSGFLSSSDHRSPYPEARSDVGGFWRCGPHRAKFLAESVWTVKQDLEKIGSGLIIRVGMIGQLVEELLTTLKNQDNTDVVGVWMTGEEGVEEKREERDIRKVTEAHGKDFRLWIDEKYFIDDRDLPFDTPKDLPDVFTTFRKQVEPLREGPRQPSAAPEKLPPLPPSIPPQAQPFSIPDTLEKIISSLHAPLDSQPLLPNAPEYPSPTKSAHDFEGGSKAGFSRVHHLLMGGHASSYKDTRNGLLGLDFSTKLSAWLALGCITARQVHQQLLQFEDGQDSKYKDSPGYGKGENKGTAAIRFELLWRDYMRLCTRKFGPRLFRVSGFRADESYPWKSPSNPRESSKEDIQKMLARFLRGDTGTSFIDASQRELYHTGYTSNRARQNVASFLSKHLKLDWRIGAEWYESLLADYDVSSNWGNWQYVAGVGNDPRGEARVFNPIKQGFDYDSQGQYVKAWLPRLRDVEDVMVVFQPWLMSQEEKKQKGIQSDKGEWDWVERPLVKIDFRVGGKKGPRRGGGGGAGGGGGGGGGPSKGGSGRYGGSSRNKEAGGESGRGRGGGKFGSRGAGGGGSGRGKGGRGGDKGGRSERKGDMEKARGVGGSLEDE